MLITRHRDRPGTIGRIGQLLGAADVNISAMHLARSAPRADALMILAVDDDVPPELEEAIRADEGVHDLWTIRLGRDRDERSRPPTRSRRASTPSLGIRPPRRIRVGRAGPLPGPGRVAAHGPGAAPGAARPRGGSPRRARRPLLPLPAAAPHAIVHSPLARATETASLIARP